MFVNQKVKTPYGIGRIQSLRGDDIIVQPVDWKLADGKKPTFYMNPRDVKSLFLVGDEVNTTFGHGKIIDFDSSRNIYTVTLTKWTLANGKSPTLYLNDDSMAKVDDSASKRIEQILERVLKMKDEAKEAYMQRKFEEAKVKYLAAMETLRMIGDNIDGFQRAKFLELCVACHSNLSLCAFNTATFGDCITFASNTINLIDAVYTKVPDSELWRQLVSLGYTEEKLADMKLKALRIRGKAESKRGEFDEAKKSFEEAIKISRNDKVTKELDDLLMEVVKRKSSEKKKEKALWQKAFNKRDAEEEASASASKPSKSNAKSKSVSKGKEAEKGESSSEVTNYNSSSLIYPVLGLGFLGLLTGAAFWWLRRRNK